MPEKSKRTSRKRRPTKDRTLQARIPEQLDEELRDRAEQLGLSVSTVVRNVLLNTFDLVEGVVADSAQIARVIKGRKSEAAKSPGQPGLHATEPDSEAAVIGWQEAVLNRNGICEKCNAILAVGARAAVGLPVSSRPVLLCLDCLAGLAAPGDSVAPVSPTNAKPVRPASTSRAGKKPRN